MSGRGWWRSNAVALIALALLVPAAIGIVGGGQWRAYFDHRASSPVIAPADAPVEFAGAAWGPVRATALPPGDYTRYPAGARVITVAIPAHAADGAVPGCDRPVLTEPHTGRSWRSGLSSGYLPDGPVRDDTCVPDAASFTLEGQFLVPRDAVGPFTVDLEVSGALPEFLRWEVAPVVR